MPYVLVIVHLVTYVGATALNINSFGLSMILLVLNCVFVVNLDLLVTFLHLVSWKFSFYCTLARGLFVFSCDVLTWRPSSCLFYFDFIFTMFGELTTIFVDYLNAPSLLPFDLSFISDEVCPLFMTFEDCWLCLMFYVWSKLTRCSYSWVCSLFSAISTK